MALHNYYHPPVNAAARAGRQWKCNHVPSASLADGGGEGAKGEKGRGGAMDTQAVTTTTLCRCVSAQLVVQPHGVAGGRMGGWAAGLFPPTTCQSMLLLHQQVDTGHATSTPLSCCVLAGSLRGAICWGL